MATTVMADQAPQATLNGVANCRRMVIWYHIVAEVTGPSLWNSGRNSGFRRTRIPKQINLALELFNSNVCSAESEVISKIPRIPKMRPVRNRNTKRNAHPRSGKQVLTMIVANSVLCLC